MTRVSESNIAIISQTPFMVVKRGSDKCPICNWRAVRGPLGGVGLAMRIHCYREHGLRLRFGGRRGRVPDSEPVDLDAEVASHMWIVESVMNWCKPKGGADIEVIRADAAFGLMEAILTWDSSITDFAWYARRWIARIIASDRDRVLNLKREAPPIPPAAATAAVADAEPDQLEVDDEIAKMMSLLRSNPLCDTWQHVIDARFPASGKGATLSEVSLAIGVTKERIRQIEMEALAKLRRAIDPDAPKPKPKPKRDIPPQPGHFVVVATEGTERYAALDETAVMRLAEPGGEVSVFTDKRTAFVMANRLRGALAGKPRVRVRPAGKRVKRTGKPGVRVRRIRAVEDGVDIHGLTVRLVHKAPTRTNLTSMTVNTIYSVLASAGRPLTLPEIVDALLSDDSFMEKRFPDGQRRSRTTMSNMAANAVRYRTEFVVVRGMGRKRNLYAIA